MKRLRLLIFAAVALAQISVPGAMIWKRQHTLRAGRLWKFRTAPVDPVDPTRGRYLTLRFEAEEFPSPEPLSNSASTQYATLKEGPDGFAVVDQIGEELFTAENAIQVDYYGYYQGKVRVHFPFDKFWVTEANAPAAEQAYWSNSNRNRQEVYATVRVAPGDAAIEELFIAGQPLREYLRANAVTP